MIQQSTQGGKAVPGKGFSISDMVGKWQIVSLSVAVIFEFFTDAT